MSHETVIIEIGDDHVGEITLNRPESLPTFNRPLAKELNQALWKLDSENRVRVIILKGAGKAFCAGIDISDFSDKSVMEYREWVECVVNPLVTISRMNKPVIALHLKGCNSRFLKGINSEKLQIFEYNENNIKEI